MIKSESPNHLNSHLPSLHPQQVEKLAMPRDDDVGLGITFFKTELEALMARINSLEKENQELKQETVRLKAQLNMLKTHDNERKSMLWKKFQNSIDEKIIEEFHHKPTFLIEQKLNPVKEVTELGSVKEKPTKIPAPPTRPAPSPKEINGGKILSTSVQGVQRQGAPPPPPPPPSKVVGTKAVRRVPAVMEFYRSLMKRGAQRENKNNATGFLPVANSRDMIGEIENRSTYLTAIKSDVEKYGQLINFLTREVQTTASNYISEVESFVKWLDAELACLVDERAVLKHFPQWPERKADELREAAFSYRDLKSLESELSTFKNDPKQSLTESFKGMQSLQDRAEQSISNIERVREGTSKRYQELQIPWQWMLETGLVGQIKLSTLTLAKEHMKRIAKELLYCETSQAQDLLLQGVRFAFRVHQFAGGFDGDTMHAFEELKKNGSSASLELDLEHYIVPTPTASSSVYAANLTETPRLLKRGGVFSNIDEKNTDIWLPPGRPGFKSLARTLSFST